MGFWSGFEGLTGHQPGAFKGFSLKDILDKDMWERRERLNQGRRLEETGVPDTIVASIGPAGENMVHYATISNDGGRHAGRGGAGAVMGSKHLKAIALSGNHAISVAQPELLEEKNRLSHRGTALVKIKDLILDFVADHSIIV